MQNIRKEVLDMKEIGRKLNKSQSDLVFASTPTGPTEPPIIITTRKKFIKLFSTKIHNIETKEKNTNSGG